MLQVVKKRQRGDSIPSLDAVDATPPTATNADEAAIHRPARGGNHSEWRPPMMICIMKTLMKDVKPDDKIYKHFQ